MASINHSFLHTPSGTSIHLLTAVDGWLTERSAVKHHFYDRVILLSSDDIDNWMAVTNAEKASIIAADKAKSVPTQTFIDLWTRCYDCQYDASKEKAFTCNGVALTYQEAIDVYNAPRISYPRPTGLAGNFNSPDAKTLIYIPTVGLYGTQDFSYIARGSHIKILRVGYTDNDVVWVSNLYQAFQGSSIEKIIGIIKLTDTITANGANAFTSATNLKEIKIKNLKVNITFQWQKELSYESLRYLVDNASNTSPITVTVHPSVYSLMTGDSLEVGKDDTPWEGEVDDVPDDDMGLSPMSTAANPTEWASLVTDAAAKNITFATV